MSPSIDIGMLPNVTSETNDSKIPIPGICEARAMNVHRSDSPQQKHGEVETEFLIVGAGPAGASLACFLTSYGEQHDIARLSRILTR